VQLKFIAIAGNREIVRRNVILILTPSFKAEHEKKLKNERREERKIKLQLYSISEISHDITLFVIIG
jgi:hypothetical protein